MNTKEKDRFSFLASKYIAKEISKKEQRELETKFLSNKNRKSEFEKIETHYNILKDPASHFAPDRQQALLNLKTRINKLKVRRILNWSYSAAASIIVLISIYQYWIYNSKSITIQCNTSKIIRHTLPDNSTVDLNNGASISYKKNFTTRNIKLTGEAYFKVVKNSSPFIVFSGHTKTTVLGTEFNINAKTPDLITLTVNKGSVQFKNVETMNSVVLQKNQQAKCESKKKAIIVTQIENANYMAWKTRELTFNNTPLIEVLSTVQELLNMQIIINDEVLKNHCITADFTLTSIDDFLTELGYIIPIESKKTAQNITIYTAQ